MKKILEYIEIYLAIAMFFTGLGMALLTHYTTLIEVSEALHYSMMRAGLWIGGVTLLTGFIIGLYQIVQKMIVLLDQVINP